MKEFYVIMTYFYLVLMASVLATVSSGQARSKD